MSDCNSALILALGERARHADQRLLGLELIERILLGLRAQGIERVLLAGPGDLVPDHLQDNVDVIAAADEPSAIAAALARTEGALLIVPGDVVYHPKLVEALRNRARRSGSSVLYSETSTHPALLLRAADRRHLPAGADLAAVAEALERQAVAEQLAPPRGFFIQPVTDAPGRARAERMFLRTNWRPHDGIIARVLNKHISVAISARIADLPITPNHMTGAAFVIALAGVACAAWGSYWSFLLGATLVQIQSVLDGCDGELARMRYQSSAWGAWFDTIVDDVIGVLWVFALGLGAYRWTGDWAYLAIGVSGALLYFIATGLIYFVLWRHGASSHSVFTFWFEEGASHDSYPDPHQISTWLKYSIRRDFFVFFFFVMSLFGLIRVSLMFAVLGALGWFTAMMIQIAKRGLRVVPHS